MPRPLKCRRVCCLPKVSEFRPVQGSDHAPETITLTVDEYETIRLIDNEGLSQEECGVYMKIARTTVQQIYNTARQKIAAVLVSGAALKIEGGEYQLCRGHAPCCAHGECSRHRHTCRMIHSETEEK